MLNARGGGGGGGVTPYVMGDTYVPRFWPPFFTLAGSSTIFLGYFFSSTNSKAIFWGTKTTNFYKNRSFWPQIQFFPRSFWVQFSAASGTHTHQFSGRVPRVMHLAWYGCKLSAQKNATLGVGVIWVSRIAMFTMIMIVIYISNFFSIKHWIVTKFWVSIAYIKLISTILAFRHSQN